MHAIFVLFSQGGRGSSSHKGGLNKAANKAAKQVALAFAKRTLARCQKFEETEKSCFREPFLWNVLSAPLPKNDAIDGNTQTIEQPNKLHKTQLCYITINIIFSMLQVVSQDLQIGQSF